MFPLKSLHTFQLNANAKQLHRISSESQLVDLIKQTNGSPRLFLGQGSNTVFVSDFEGEVLAIELKGIDHRESEHNHTLCVAAGENWHDFVLWCLENEIYGLENLALIPGTVGAAPIQNIGAYGVEIERFIEYVEVFNIEREEFSRFDTKACKFGYRSSVFKSELSGQVVITRVGFRVPKSWQPVCDYAELSKLDNPAAREIFDKVVAVRRAKLPDPGEIGNAGSFFKNPVVSKKHYEGLLARWKNMPHYPVSEIEVKIPAAWLIDNLGFKGKSIGGIRCHPNQPLVLTNTGEGTGEALLTMAREIRDTVKDTFGITLENEVRLIGKNGSIEL